MTVTVFLLGNSNCLRFKTASRVRESKTTQRLKFVKVKCHSGYSGEDSRLPTKVGDFFRFRNPSIIMSKELVKSPCLIYSLSHDASNYKR